MARKWAMRIAAVVAVLFLLVVLSLFSMSVLTFGFVGALKLWAVVTGICLVGIAVLQVLILVRFPGIFHFEKEVIRGIVHVLFHIGIHRLTKPKKMSRKLPPEI